MSNKQPTLEARYFKDPANDQQIAEALSKVLFDLDPADTCCKENDAFDEYDAIAQSIVDAVRAGKPFPIAIREQMVASFGRGYFDEQTLNALSQAVITQLDHTIAAKVSPPA